MFKNLILLGGAGAAAWYLFKTERGQELRAQLMEKAESLFNDAQEVLAEGAGEEPKKLVKRIKSAQPAV